jgi:hypothetical protein
MKHFATVTACCLAAGGLAACGSSGLHYTGSATTATTTASGTHVAAPRPTGGGRTPVAGAEAFAQALGSHNFRAACQDLTSDARQEMLAISKASRCPAALAALFNFPGATQALQGLKVARPVPVKLDVDQATVRIGLPTGSRPPWVMTLMRENGRWFVANLNTKGTPSRGQQATQAAANKGGPGSQTVGPNTPLLPEPSLGAPGTLAPQPSVGGTGGTLLPSTTTPGPNTTLP